MFQKIIIILCICLSKGCILFQVSDLDPDSEFSNLLLLYRLTNSTLINEPILTRSFSGYANGTKAFFSWNKVPNATSYKVYYSKSNSVSLVDSSSPETTNPWILIEGLDESTLYYFRLLAFLDDGGKRTQKDVYPAYTNPTIIGTASSVLAFDISAGKGNQAGLSPDLRINPYRNTLYMAAQLTSTGLRVPSNYSANSDGSNAIYRDLSIGNNTSASSFQVPNLILDFEKNKFIQSANNISLSQKPVQFHCNFDESNCIYQDVSAGQPTVTGVTPFGLLDPFTGNSITITRNGNTGINTLSMFHCDNDGANCKFIDLSSYGAGFDTGFDPHGTIDNNDGKLLIVVRNNSVTGLSRPYLYKCELDGSNCSFTDISAGQGANAGNLPFITVDLINSKILTFTSNAVSSANKVSLFRCDLSGLNCVHYDLSTMTGQANDSGNSPTAILDPINNKMLVYAQNSNTLGLSLYRCNLDVSNCTHTNLSAISNFTGTQSGFRPSAGIDPGSGKIIITSENTIGSFTGIPYAFIH